MGEGKFITERLKMKSHLALSVTAISALIITLSICILQGFKTELYSGISSICSEIRIFSADGKIRTNIPERQSLEADKRIESVDAAVYQPSIIKKDATLQGVLFHNSDKIQSRLGIIIPESLSKTLNVNKGDTLLSYFITDRVKARKFIVEDICKDPALLDKNTVIAFAGTEDLQRIKGYQSDEADCLEVRLAPGYRSKRQIERLYPEIAYRTDYLCEPSTRNYHLIYDWLQILDTNVLVIMTLMCIVAAFNMISAFLIMVIRSTSTIGTLKTLGMTSGAVSKTFVRMAAETVLKGLIAGNALALVVCLIQDRTHLLRLDPQNYFVSYVPIHVDIPLILTANLIAFAVIMLAVSIPTRKIAQIDPAQSTNGQTL